MAAIPPFSHFSAASELLVTAGVFYFFVRAWRENNFRWAFIWILVGFEAIVNITYMASRLASYEPAPDRPAWTTLLLALHGTLSLFMFLGLIAFLLVAYRQRHVEQVNFFQTHAALTATFLALWVLSVLSGEAIYVLELANVVQV